MSQLRFTELCQQQGMFGEPLQNDYLCGKSFNAISRKEHGLEEDKVQSYSDLKSLFRTRYNRELKLRFIQCSSYSDDIKGLFEKLEQITSLENPSLSTQKQAMLIFRLLCDESKHQILEKSTQDIISSDLDLLFQISTELLINKQQDQ